MKPLKDENGNQVIDNDGNPVTVIKTIKEEIEDYIYERNGNITNN